MRAGDGLACAGAAGKHRMRRKGMPPLARWLAALVVAAAAASVGGRATAAAATPPVGPAAGWSGFLRGSVPVLPARGPGAGAGRVQSPTAPDAPDAPSAGSAPTGGGSSGTAPFGLPASEPLVAPTEPAVGGPTLPSGPVVEKPAPPSDTAGPSSPVGGGAFAQTTFGEAGGAGTSGAADLVAAALRRLPAQHLDAVLHDISVQAGLSQGLSLGQTVQDVLHGKLPLTPQSLMQTVLRLFLRQVWASASLMGRLVLLAVGAAALELVGRAVGYDDAARVAALVVYLAIAALALASFVMAVTLANQAVNEMGTLMAAALPLMVTLLVAMGGVTSAALLQPVVLGSAEAIGQVIGTVAVPLLFVAGVVDIVGQVTPYRLGQVAGFLRAVGAWMLGGLLTVFLGVLVVAGSLGPVADGLVLKLGKFAANALIPVVGKMFADAAEMVMGTSLLLKNVVGGLGLLAILLVLVVPLVKLVALVFVYRLAGTVVSPLQSAMVPGILGSMAQTLMFVALAVGAMALMCFLALAALIVAGSAGVLPG